MRVCVGTMLFFSYKKGELISHQIEELESICKKLANANGKPSNTSVESKLLSSLPPKFSTFRMGWECTPKAERKNDALIARLIREDKQMTETEENASLIALQIQALELKRNIHEPKGKNKKNEGTSKKNKIEALKKRTKCSYCQEKGHWFRECPARLEAEKGGKKQSTGEQEAYIRDVTNQVVANNKEVYSAVDSDNNNNIQLLMMFRGSLDKAKVNEDSSLHR